MDAILKDHREAPISAAERAMLDYAVKLTTQPQSMCQQDVQALREVGFDDPTISHIVQVAALFNYYNRLADGLGIEDEPEW